MDAPDNATPCFDDDDDDDDDDDGRACVRAGMIRPLEKGNQDGMQNAGRGCVWDRDLKRESKLRILL
jgi:hypothetical protein